MHHIHHGNSKTELQWNKQGFKIKDGATGQDFWSNPFCNEIFTYYEADEVEQMTEAEQSAFKESQRVKRRQQEQERRKRKKAEEERQQRIDYFEDNYFTAVQLLRMGYIPDGKCVVGMPEAGKSEDFFYYDINNCAFDEDQAEKLLKTYPYPWNDDPDNYFCDPRYNGKKWW